MIEDLTEKRRAVLRLLAYHRTSKGIASLPGASASAADHRIEARVALLAFRPGVRQRDVTSRLLARYGFAVV